VESKVQCDQMRQAHDTDRERGSWKMNEKMDTDDCSLLCPRCGAKLKELVSVWKQFLR
jgi:hypothetical protein